MRFTTPTAGSYSASGTLTDIDAGGGDGVVFTFGAQSGSVSPGNPATLSLLPVMLPANTIVDLVIGRGALDYFNDSTRIQLVFTRA